MDFREINYVMAIAQYQNITKAAEALFISQPTLSKFLISLEEELGLHLFRKAGHKYYLTYAGERYVEKASQILHIKKDLDAELSEIRKQEQGILKIGFTTMRCTSMFPAALPLFHKKYPNVKIDLMEAFCVDLDNALANGDIEAAFYLSPIHANPKLEYLKIMNEELLLCISKNHPLNDRAIPTPDTPYPFLDPVLLKEERLLHLSSDQRTGQLLDDIFHKKNIMFADSFCIRSIPAITQLVSTGYGVSFLFESHLHQNTAADQISCYRFEQTPVTCDFVAATRKGSSQSEYVREFIAIVQELYS